MKKLIICILFIFLTCTSAPKRKDYTCEECFISMQCLYMMLESKEKSICDKLVESCRDALKDIRKQSK